MVRHRSQMKSRVQHELRGGKGEVTFLDMMQPDESYGKMRVCSEISMEKGCSIGRHPHEVEAELFIVKQGIATIDDNGTIKKCGVGDVIYTGNGEFHSLMNEDEETLVVYAIVIN